VSLVIRKQRQKERQRMRQQGLRWQGQRRQLSAMV